MAGFSGTESSRIPEARDFSHEKRFHYTYIPIAQTLVLLVADGSSPYQRPTLDVGLYRNLHTVACSMKTGPTLGVGLYRNAVSGRDAASR